MSSVHAVLCTWSLFISRSSDILRFLGTGRKEKKYGYSTNLLTVNFSFHGAPAVFKLIPGCKEERQLIQ